MGSSLSPEYRCLQTRLASQRSIPDAALIPAVNVLHEANYWIDGVREMWHAMHRAGWTVSRDQVARLRV